MVGYLKSRELLIRGRNWFWKILAVLFVLPTLVYFSEISWNVVAGTRQVSSDAPWELQYDPSPVPDLSTVQDAESLLRQAHFLFIHGKHAQALVSAQELVLRYPNFQLGQLLFADLLSLTSGNGMDATVASQLGSPGATLKLQQLNAEARLRLSRPEAAEYNGKQPAGLIHLSRKVPFVIVVDAFRSRLYVMSHSETESAVSSGHGLKVIFETYMSVGQRGVGKHQKGDGKTPLGVYFIQKSYPGHVLPDLYGAGALTLNYPNDLDVMDGKTGSGIWLHGSPSDEFARAPQASDGCVVLSNPDMEFLMRLQLPPGTPVFIQRQIQWVEPQKNATMHKLVESSMKDSGEQLAMFIWQDGARNMSATLSSSDNKLTASTWGLKSDYWIEQEQQWRSVSPSATNGLRAERQPSMQTSSNGRPGIAVVQMQEQR